MGNCGKANTRGLTGSRQWLGVSGTLLICVTGLVSPARPRSAGLHKRTEDLGAGRGDSRETL